MTRSAGTPSAGTPLAPGGCDDRGARTLHRRAGLAPNRATIVAVILTSTLAACAGAPPSATAPPPSPTAAPTTTRPLPPRPSTTILLPPPPTPPDASYDRAIDGARRFLQQSATTADAPTELMLGNLAQRYGYADLARFRDRATAKFAGRTAFPDGGFSHISKADLERLYARLADRGATLEPGWASSLAHDTFPERAWWLFGSALHCDTPGFPAEFEQVARSSLTDPLPEADGSRNLNGVLQATHLGLGLLAMRELGCAPPWLAGLEADTAETLAARLRAEPLVDDFSLEMIAVLYELGRADLVPESWIAQSLAAQLPDGSFAVHGTEHTGSWHSTLYALWVLSAFRDPAARARGPVFFAV